MDPNCNICLALCVVVFAVEVCAQPAQNSGAVAPPAIDVPKIAVEQSPTIDGREACEPPALAPQEGQQSFHLRTDKRSLISQVLSAYGIRTTVDQSVNAQSIRFDTDEVDFTNAGELLKLATDTF